MPGETMIHDKNGGSTGDWSSSGLSRDHEESLDLYRDHLRMEPVTPRQWLRKNGHLSSTPAFRDQLWSHYVLAYPPPRVPGFAIEDVLGEGGMGRVYLGRDQSLDRRVAIKELTEALRPGSAYAERFRREAQILARLEHPNIVKVYQFVSHEGREFIAMEYLSRGSLADRLGETTTDVFTVIPRMIAKLARAIDYAHGQGIIHRDLKPGNILLDQADEPKLGDFGLAKDLLAPIDLTRGAVLGTHHYMAPEQVEGQSPVPGTDIWAFGVILFRVFSGRFPFEGHTVAELHAAIRTALPNELPGETPTELRRICLKCLEKDPGNRFQSGNELAVALEKVAGCEPPRPLRRRSRRRWVLVAALFALIAAGATMIVYRHTRDTGTSVTMREKLPGPTKSITFSADGRYGLAEVGGSQVVVWDLRKEQIVNRFTHGQLTRNDDVCGSVAVSADGSRIAAIGLNPVCECLAQIDLFHPVTFDQNVFEGSNRFGHSLAFSPDGKLLAVETFERGVLGAVFRGGRGESRLSVYDIVSRKPTVFPVSSAITCLAFSSDSRFGLTGSAEPQVCVWDLTKKAKDRDIPVPAGGVDAVACSEDGERIFTASIANDSVGAYSRSGTSEKSIATTTATSGKMTCAALSRHGRGVTGHRDGTVVYWDLDTPAKLVFRHPGAEVTALAISPDGRAALAAFSTGDVTLQQLPSPAK